MPRKRKTHSIPARDLKRVESDIHDYLVKTEAPIEVADNRSLVVRASLEASGMTGPVSVREIIKNLPPISDRMQEFCLRAAVESKRNSEWAEEFGVSPQTIGVWFGNKIYQGYIAAYRYERSLLNMGRMLSLESSAYNALRKIVTMRINSANVEHVSTTAFKIIDRVEDLRHGREPGARTAGMVNLFFDSAEKQRERNVTPDDGKTIEELEAEIRQLSTMLEHFDDEAG